VVDPFDSLLARDGVTAWRTDAGVKCRPGAPTIRGFPCDNSGLE
jgi:hypothetical protein